MVNARCVVGCCDNDKRYHDRIIINSNITSGKLVFHKIPVNEERRKAWIHVVLKGREAFEPPENFKVCSNFFFIYITSSTQT